MWFFWPSDCNSGHKHTFQFKPFEILCSSFPVLNAVIRWWWWWRMLWNIPVQVQTRRSGAQFEQSIKLYNKHILDWGKRSVYLLAFDSPWRIRRPPHVTLELFECGWLPVCCHLPQHIIHHFPNGLLLICVNRLVHGVDGTRAVLFHVLFNLPQGALTNEGSGENHQISGDFRSLHLILSHICSVNKV